MLESNIYSLLISRETIINIILYLNLHFQFNTGNCVTNQIFIMLSNSVTIY